MVTIQAAVRRLQLSAMSVRRREWGALPMRTTLIALIVLVVAALAFYVGGVVGFVEGRAVQLERQAPFEASWITATLSALRAGRSSDAVALLEQQLDVQLITHGAHSLTGPPWFERPNLDPALGYKLLRPAAEYRTQNPPVGGDPESASTLNSIVDCLRKAPLDAPDAETREFLRSCYRLAW